MSYPMWVKPVKSFSSYLAFGVANQQEFQNALTRIRESIGWVGTPFGAVLERLELPPEIAGIGGGYTSYILANIYLGAQNEAELATRWFAIRCWYTSAEVC